MRGGEGGEGLPVAVGMNANGRSSFSYHLRNISDECQRNLHVIRGPFRPLRAQSSKKRMFTRD
jgi:hypothetical protein